MVIRAVLLAMSGFAPDEPPVIGEPAFSVVEFADVDVPAGRSGVFIFDVAVGLPPVKP